jgi:hypothetical protein
VSLRSGYRRRTPGRKGLAPEFWSGLRAGSHAAVSDRTIPQTATAPRPGRTESPNSITPTTEGTPRTAGEVAFLALGPGAERWLIEAASVGAQRIRTKMAAAVELAALVGTDPVDAALAMAAEAHRFDEGAWPRSATICSPGDRTSSWSAPTKRTPRSPAPPPGRSSADDHQSARAGRDDQPGRHRRHGTGRAVRLPDRVAGHRTRRGRRRPGPLRRTQRRTLEICRALARFSGQLQAAPISGNPSAGNPSGDKPTESGRL